MSKNKSTKMTYKDSAPPGKQVVTHNRTTSDVLLETFRRPNDTEEKIPLGKKVFAIYHWFSAKNELLPFEVKIL